MGAGGEREEGGLRAEAAAARWAASRVKLPHGGGDPASSAPNDPTGTAHPRTAGVLAHHACGEPTGTRRSPRPPTSPRDVSHCTAASLRMGLRARDRLHVRPWRESPAPRPGSCPRKGLLAPLGRWLGSCPRARGTPQSHGGPITLHPRQARGNSRQGHVSGTSEPMRHTPVRTAVGRLAAISCAGTPSPTGCCRSCRRTTRRRSLRTRRCVCMEWFVDGVHSQPTRAGRRARTSRIA